MRNSWVFSLGASTMLLLIAVSGCSSDHASQSSAKENSFDASVYGHSSGKNQEMNASDLSQLRRERLVPMAFGHDGFPRIKRFYRGKGEQAVIDRIEYDFNGDGRVDLVQWFDETGQWIKTEAADLNGDGIFDVISHYKKELAQTEPELVMEEHDSLSSGHIDVWKYFKNGRLVRREIDRHSLGHPDYREFFENGTLVRIEKDENSDGSPDSQLRLKPVVKPHGSEPGKKDTSTQAR